jgi:hypothetical protein
MRSENERTEARVRFFGGVSQSDPPGLISMPVEHCLVMFGSSFRA